MIQNAAGEAVANPIARLGANHGYAIDGDIARLNADILFDETRLCGQQWALQLWADDAIKIAEIPLGLLPVNGSGFVRSNGVAEAFPPAGQAAHVMSLRLVNDLDGVSDQATYADPMTIAQPRLNGTVCCSFTDQQIGLTVAGIENPRSADNLSGTLALELWSLDTPYAGGAWSGMPVASLVIGSLAGQSEWTDNHFSTPAAPLPAEGSLMLMLREWTPAGYVTRDFRALARPAVTPVARTATPTAAEVAVPQEKAPEAPKVEKVEKVEKASAKPAKADVAGVSVNVASAQELAAVKGISHKLARAVVAGRPYRALEELLKVKGMGPKLLQRLLGFLKL